VTNASRNNDRMIGMVGFAVEEYHSVYARSHKADGRKVLRCFPNHAAGGHKKREYKFVPASGCTDTSAPRTDAKAGLTFRADAKAGSALRTDAKPGS
jgi:hypothetical protein